MTDFSRSMEKFFVYILYINRSTFVLPKPIVINQNRFIEKKNDLSLLLDLIYSPRLFYSSSEVLPPPITTDRFFVIILKIQLWSVYYILAF